MASEKSEVDVNHTVEQSEVGMILHTRTGYIETECSQKLKAIRMIF